MSDATAGAGAEVLSISEAKAQLSRLMNRVRSGHTVYIGAYGRPEAILAPAPVGTTVVWGVQADEVTTAEAAQLAGLDEPDPEWDAMWERFAGEHPA
jgi:prevent-host-death family protein